MSVVKTYYPKPEDIEIANGKDESTATGANLRINTRNEDVSVRTISSDDPVSIFAGTGNDTLLGGDSDLGNDYISGGDGNDSALGRAGKDIMDGGDGNDSLDGGIGDDSLNGSAGDDSIIGGDGDDTIIGGAGNDTINGGVGDDVLNISTGDTVTSGAGADRINFDLAAGFDPSNPPSIIDFVSGEDTIAILGQNDAKLSYDPTAKELLLDGQRLIQLDAVLNEGDLLTSTGGNIPFEATAPASHKLSGTVYNDTNLPDANAIEAADKTIAGVKVELFKADAAGKIVGNALGNDITDAKGFYEFADLADGDYVVKETQPAGYRSVADKDGGNFDEIKATIAGDDSLGNDFLEETSSVKPPGGSGPAEGEKTKVHQFFSSQNSYFYTVDENEKNYIAENLDNYELREEEKAIRTLGENEVDQLTGAESEEVYRFFNTSNGSHLYTTSEVEKASVESNDNYSSDENMFFAYEEKVEGSIEVHRFYDAAEDIHMFTHSAEEITEMQKEDSGFNDEGVAFYVMEDTI